MNTRHVKCWLGILDKYTRQTALILTTQPWIYKVQIVEALPAHIPSRLSLPNHTLDTIPKQPIHTQGPPGSLTSARSLDWT